MNMYLLCIRLHSACCKEPSCCICLRGECLEAGKAGKAEDDGHPVVLWLCATAVCPTGYWRPVSEPAVSILIMSDLLTCALGTFSSNVVRSLCTGLVVITLLNSFSSPPCHGGEDVFLLADVYHGDEDCP